MKKKEYIQANKDWLVAKSKEEGVKALPKGIFYKVLAEGNASSAQPTIRSIITAHYNLIESHTPSDKIHSQDLVEEIIKGNFKK